MQVKSVCRSPCLMARMIKVDILDSSGEHQLLSALRKFQRFTDLLVDVIQWEVVISDGRCCDLGNFPSTLCRRTPCVRPHQSRRPTYTAARILIYDYASHPALSLQETRQR